MREFKLSLVFRGPKGNLLGVRLPIAQADLSVDWLFSVSPEPAYKTWEHFFDEKGNKVPGCANIPESIEWVEGIGTPIHVEADLESGGRVIRMRLLLGAKGGVTVTEGVVQSPPSARPDAKVSVMDVRKVEEEKSDLLARINYVHNTTHTTSAAAETSLSTMHKEMDNLNAKLKSWTSKIDSSPQEIPWLLLPKS